MREGYLDLLNKIMNRWTICFVFFGVLMIVSYVLEDTNSLIYFGILTTISAVFVCHANILKKLDYLKEE